MEHGRGAPSASGPPGSGKRTGADGADGAATGAARDRPAAGPRRHTGRVDEAREQAVLALWKRGRRDEAFRALMDLYGGPLLAYARRIARDDETARDVRQQVFLEVWRGLDRFEARATLWTWLCAITHNRCLDAGRRQGRIVAGEVAVDFEVLAAAADPSEPPTSPGLTHQRQALEHCLRKLPESIRQQVLMRAYQGLSYDEIGTIVGDPAGTVQVRVARALPKLRRCLRAQGVDR
ncbi:MAG TPA: sigma-70 family RNA polymerase sigma factor [Kofleriaceae bacterium]|nr:sigma-70 family RNA polymerase sigma factor [Kofleriaceae bacterium]